MPECDGKCSSGPRKDPALNIYQISARTGDSPDRIRHLRTAGHELYSQAWKSGTARNAPLRLEESKVRAWLETLRQQSNRQEEL
ncbi:hypothetical protein NRB56_45010 [Nocardia sp. RB56]|uniref:Uncharacterized protein n=1 Tax=Nocardia aurantia TaxID=2585199 RepID=A0A7K0DT61_9NOCA|nr:hypothetical protein [Nocardia aurantia]